METSGQLQAQVGLSPGTHWIGGWVGPVADLDMVAKKKIPLPGNEHRSSSPQPTHQTNNFNWNAIPGLNTDSKIRNH